MKKKYGIGLILVSWLVLGGLGWSMATQGRRVTLTIATTLQAGDSTAYARFRDKRLIPYERLSVGALEGALRHGFWNIAADMLSGRNELPESLLTATVIEGVLDAPSLLPAAALFGAHLDTAQLYRHVAQACLLPRPRCGRMERALHFEVLSARSFVAPTLFTYLDGATVVANTAIRKFSKDRTSYNRHNRGHKYTVEVKEKYNIYGYKSCSPFISSASCSAQLRRGSVVGTTPCYNFPTVWRRVEPLQLAMTVGDTQALRLLVHAPGGEQALGRLWAQVDYRERFLVDYLDELGEALGTADSSSVPRLSAAVRGRRHAAVRRLLHQYAGGLHSDYALCRALEEAGSAPMVALLVEAGLDVHAPYPDTTAYGAFFCEQVATVYRRLYEQEQADPLTKYRAAVLEPPNERILGLLCEHEHAHWSALLGHPRTIGQHLLGVARVRGWVGVEVVLLRALGQIPAVFVDVAFGTLAADSLAKGGAVVDAHGNTLLHAACRYGSLETVRAIVEAGGKVGARNEAGEDALRIAACRGEPGMVALLVEAGAMESVREEDLVALYEALKVAGAAAGEELVLVNKPAERERMEGIKLCARLLADALEQRGRAFAWPAGKVWW